MFEINKKSSQYLLVISAYCIGNIVFGISRSVEISFAVAVFLLIFYVVAIRTKPVIFFLTAIAITAGIAHFNFVHSNQLQIQSKIIETDKTIHARIVSIQPKQQKQTIVAQIQNQKPKVQFTTSKYSEYEVGDIIEVQGEIQKPPDFDDFSYSDYLLLKGVVAIVKNPYIQKTGNIQKPFPLNAISNFKTTIVETVNTGMPSPESSFLNGILIGVREEIPEEILEAFNATSTTHVIAISGYNITVIALIAMKILNFYIPRKPAIFITILCVSAFVILVGDDAPVVRAGIMGSITLFAKTIGRQTKIKNILATTVIIMALINPYTIIFDVAFHLSFISTIGLIYGATYIEKFTSWLPNMFEIKESVTLTTTAQIATLPIIIMNFKRISLISILANTLIAPLLSLAMSTGAVAITATLIFAQKAQLLFIVPTYILRATISIIDWCSKIPYASKDIPQNVHLLLSIASIILIVFMIYKQHESKSKNNN